MPFCIVNPCTALAKMEFVQRWDHKGYLEVARLICMLGVLGIITYGAFNSSSSGITGFLMMGFSIGAMTFRYLENKQRERVGERQEALKPNPRFQEIETIAFSIIALLGLISLTTGLNTTAFTFWTAFSIVIIHALIKWAAGSFPKTCGNLPVRISSGFNEFKGLLFGILPANVRNIISSAEARPEAVSASAKVNVPSGSASIALAPASAAP